MSGSTVQTLDTQTTTANRSSHSSSNWVLTIHATSGDYTIAGGSHSNTNEGDGAGGNYAVKSTINPDGTISSVVYSESNYTKTTTGDSHFDDNGAGYHRTDDYDTTTTLNGDGTLSTDDNSSWTEAWDATSGSGGGGSSGSSANGSESASSTTEEPVDAAWGADKANEPTLQTGQVNLSQPQGILDGQGYSTASDATGAAGTPPA